MFSESQSEELKIGKKESIILDTRYNQGNGTWLPPYAFRYDSLFIIFTDNSKLKYTAEVSPTTHNILQSSGFEFSDNGKTGNETLHEYTYFVTQEHVDKAE